ncbi:eisosome protein SEG2-like [Pyrus ussuriensis x Pyrus communis]|uniref:Eisosome protein SEG2-like n=1 Tax=Pyrus ussuriensis x Pyrus communis TaxID=2448454 RepID=A0A5N5HQA5_9ROSA|nr:eisosome protein SEG2-like [Pyrus ussuriensis x Pyrus communis]
MAWQPLLSWIMSSSSSSSSSSYSSSEYESDYDDDICHHDPGNNNVRQAQKGHNVDDHEEDDDENDVSYEPHEAEHEDEVEEPKSSSTSDYSFTIYEPRAKRRHNDHANEALTSVQEEKKRRGKRVWSKGDELELLRGFLDYYGTRKTRITKATAKETALFYDEIKPRLKLQCSKTKMVEKLRRLKRKYHNVLKKMNEINSSGKEFRFKNAHDNAVFELSHKIWNVEKTRNNCVVESHNNNVMVKREEDNVAASSSVADHERPTTSFDENNNVTNVDDNMNNGHDVRGLIVGLAMNPMPLSLRGKMGSGGGGGVGELVEDEKWRQQQILELEAYEKRLDLVQHQVKAALEELRSKGGA